MDFIKSPLNYTGNKFRIISQLLDVFPKKINNFVDLFCGGGTVGFNTNAEKIFLIDQNKHVIELLKFIAASNFNELILKIEAKIKKYSLSYSFKYGTSLYYSSMKKDNNGLKHYNLKGFNELKTDFNSMKNKFSNDALILLYLLIIYGFNNDIRFNKNGNFNIPVGKTDFNKNNFLKLKKFVERANSINYEFICSSYADEFIDSIIKKSDFIYLDPPYLITTAVYNENGGWTEKSEEALLNFLQKCIVLKKNFVLSNVIRKKGKTNKQLELWIERNKHCIELKSINLHYKNSSYNKNVRDGSEEEIVVVSRFNEI